MKLNPLLFKNCVIDSFRFIFVLCASQLFTELKETVILYFRGGFRGGGWGFPL